MIVASLLLPAFVAVTGAIALSAARVRARTENEVRLRQLQEAADLIAIHAQVLDRFLGDKDAPVFLKSALITYSDAMSDKVVVLKIAEWFSSRPMRVSRSQEDQNDKELSEGLAALMKRRPDLAKDFAHAVMTAAVGSILRWPESAALVEQVGARMAATPEREIDLAVTAASFGTNGLFGLPGRVHAMA